VRRPSVANGFNFLCRLRGKPCRQTPRPQRRPTSSRYPARTVKPGTVILHSRADEVVPFANSEELVRKSGLPELALIEVGTDHRLADPEPLEAMLRACQEAGK
jgi:hypothetical protein